MASTLNGISECCAPNCESTTPVLIPGPPGGDCTPCADGAAGVNAYTILSAAFAQPAALSNVLINVVNGSWAQIGQILFVEGGGYYEVVSKTSSTQITVQNLDYPGNAAPAASVANGGGVSPGGLEGVAGQNGSPANVPLTTKGDLLTRDATANIRFGVGTNGTRPVADSAQASGWRNDKVNLNVTAEVAGALGIANGGTGQATANPAFNALSPVTTRGDLIVRNATVNTRLAIGAANRILASDGTDPSWRQLVQADISAGGPMSRYGLLGSLSAANFNIATDQAITILSGITRYVIRRIVVDNASISLTTAAGGIYAGAAKSGTIIVAAAQVYSALTASAKFKDLTLEAVVGTDIFTGGTIYLSLTTAQGSAATGNVWVFGENLT